MLQLHSILHLAKLKTEVTELLKLHGTLLLNVLPVPLFVHSCTTTEKSQGQGQGPTGHDTTAEDGQWQHGRRQTYHRHWLYRPFFTGDKIRTFSISLWSPRDNIHLFSSLLLFLDNQLAQSLLFPSYPKSSFFILSPCPASLSLDNKLAICYLP